MLLSGEANGNANENDRGKGWRMDGMYRAQRERKKEKSGDDDKHREKKNTKKKSAEKENCPTANFIHFWRGWMVTRLTGPTSR